MSGPDPPCTSSPLGNLPEFGGDYRGAPKDFPGNGIWFSGRQDWPTSHQLGLLNIWIDIGLKILRQLADAEPAGDTRSQLGF